MRTTWIWIAMFGTAAACGEVVNPLADAPVVPGPEDGPAATDGGPEGRCDPGKPFGAATLVPNVNSVNDEQGFGLTADELTAFVSHVVQPPNLSVRLLATTRTSIDDDFGVVSAGLTSKLNDVIGEETGGNPSADGTVLYFHRQNPNGITVFAAVRGTTAEPFSTASSLRVGAATLVDGVGATLSANGTSLYWVDLGDFAVRTAAAGSTPTAFGTAKRISTFGIQSNPVLSADELTMFYSLGTAVDDVLVTTRASLGELFAPGVPVPNVSSAKSDMPVGLTRDGCILYISSNRPGGVGGFDIYEARRAR